MNSQFESEGLFWKRHVVPDALFDSRVSQSTRHIRVSSELISICQTALSEILPGAFPVRTTLFSKSPDESWSLGWHQDRVIAVTEKHELGGYTNWTLKDGVWHVEPPVEILNQMVFVQIYLDDVSATDGPTELAFGTHKFGKIYRDKKDHIIANAERHLCLAERGDMLICHSLILHRSRPSQTQNQRRILRIDFAKDDLPNPLIWNRVTAVD